MKKLDFKSMEIIEGGSSDCTKSVAFGMALGSVFGGVGAVVGAAVAATGPNCLDWWG